MKCICKYSYASHQWFGATFQKLSFSIIVWGPKLVEQSFPHKYSVCLSVQAECKDIHESGLAWRLRSQQWVAEQEIYPQTDAISDKKAPQDHYSSAAPRCEAPVCSLAPFCSGSIKKDRPTLSDLIRGWSWIHGAVWMFREVSPVEQDRRSQAFNSVPQLGLNAEGCRPPLSS